MADNYIERQQEHTRPEKQLGNRHRNMGKRKRLPAVKSKRR